MLLLVNSLTTAAVKVVHTCTGNFRKMPKSQIKKQDINKTMIASIDTYLKFLHPTNQLESSIWEEFYNFFCNKTRIACFQRPGTLAKTSYFVSVFCVEKMFQRQNVYNHNNFYCKHFALTCNELSFTRSWPTYSHINGTSSVH